MTKTPSARAEAADTPAIETFHERRGQNNPTALAFRERFAKTLNAALDRHATIPTGHGRLVASATLLGVSTNTAHGWLQGRALPEIWRIPEIARMLDIPLDELVSGATTSALELDERYSVLELHDQSSLSESCGIYLLPEALERIAIPPGCRLMRIQNDDLSGFAVRNDLVIYDPCVRTIGVGSGIYVLQLDGGLLIRRADRSLHGSIRISCDNPRMPEDVMQADDFASEDAEVGKIFVIGKAVGRINLTG